MIRQLVQQIPQMQVKRIWKYRPPITRFQCWGRLVPDSLTHKGTGAEEDVITTNHQLNISDFKQYNKDIYKEYRTFIDFNLVDNILQRNLQSIRTKFSELKVLIKQVASICICLQVTMHRHNTVRSPAGNAAEASAPVRQDGHENGTVILVHSRYIYTRVALNTQLQAVAIRIYL